jgi:hypothetical protein
MVKKIAIVFLAVVVLALGAYATWYSLERNDRIAQNIECEKKLLEPGGSIRAIGLPGKIAVVDDLCVRQVVPPSLWNLIRGKMVFENVPNHMKVNEGYSFKDVLLGRYSYGLDINLPCNPTATTTDCSSLPPLSQQTSTPEPYVSETVAEPIVEWTSATDTPVFFLDYTFMLPAGWHGEVYEKFGGGGYHAWIRKGSVGFSIDCPPDGKGLESATRVSATERTFIEGTTTYSVAFETWSIPGNDPWSFVWLREHTSDWPNTLCIALGGIDPETHAAMESLYETWSF